MAFAGCRIAVDRSADLEFFPAGAVVLHVLDVGLGQNFCITCRRFSCCTCFSGCTHYFGTTSLTSRPDHQISIGILVKLSVCTDPVIGFAHVHQQVFRIVIGRDGVRQITFSRKIFIRKNGNRNFDVRHRIIPGSFAIRSQKCFQRFLRKSMIICLDASPVFQTKRIAGGNDQFTA